VEYIAIQARIAHEHEVVRPSPERAYRNMLSCFLGDTKAREICHLRLLRFCEMKLLSIHVAVAMPITTTKSHQ
jgi:hypothetical protein